MVQDIVQPAPVIVGHGRGKHLVTHLFPVNVKFVESEPADICGRLPHPAVHTELFPQIRGGSSNGRIRTGVLSGTYTFRTGLTGGCRAQRLSLKDDRSAVGNCDRWYVEQSPEVLLF